MLNKTLKFSIIIATLNNQETIEKNLDSIKKQKFIDYEIIVIDGGSTDKTLELIKNYNFEKILIKTQEGRGVYNAFNEGINIANNEIIVILNADDFFESEDSLKIIFSKFKHNSNLDLLMSNVKILNKNEKIIRVYKNKFFKRYMFYFGLMPPHPGIFVKKNIYLKYGFFNEDFHNAGDFEFLLRVIGKKNIIYQKIDNYIITMKYGGKSNKNLKSFLLNTIEIKKALKLNNFFSSYILISLRFFFKLFQFRRMI